MARARPLIPTSAPRRSSPPSLQARLDEHGLILLFDGNCGLCDRAVQWVLRRDADGTMRFAPLQSALGREALARLPELAGVDTMILLHRNGAWVRSTAVLETARYVGGIWGVAVLGYLVPRPLRDWLYDQVAVRRLAMFGRVERCSVPTEQQRERFFLK